MTPCDAVTDAVAEGRALTDAQRLHARQCPRCADLVDADGALADVVNAPDDDDVLPPALRAALAADHAAVAPWRPWLRASAPLAASAAVALGLLVGAPRPDLAAQPAVPYAVAALALAALVAAGVTSVFARGPRGLGVDASTLRAYVLGAPVVFALVGALTTRAAEGSSLPTGTDLAWSMAHCGLWGALFAALPGALLFAAARRSAPVSPTLAGAAAGAAAGLAGALALHVACPVAVVAHTVAGHGAPVLLGAALGALVGRRTMAP